MYLIIDLYKILSDCDDKDIKLLFSQVELLIINKNFIPFIKYAINNNKPSILSKLSKYIDINKNIENIYDINLPKNLSFKKLISFITKIII